MPLHPAIRDNRPARGSAADFLREKIVPDSRLSFVSAFFTVNAYHALRDQLEQSGDLRFLFGEPSFVRQVDKDKSESRRYRVTEDGLRLENAMFQRQQARQCADWIRRKVARSGRPGIMVLDDVLIGLDLSNRIPLLQLLQSDFADWQILLLTHDHTWYQLAREYTEHAGSWCCREMFLMENKEGQPPIPDIKDGVGPLDRANAHLNANDLMAAAVYLRAAFEARLRNVCEAHAVEVPFKKQLKDVKADALWAAIVKRQERRESLQQDEPAKNHPDFISRALISKVEMMRSTILNRLSHTESPNFEKSEVETARDIVGELQSNTFPRPQP